MGIGPKIGVQFTSIDPNGEGPVGGGGVRTFGRRVEVHHDPVQAAAQQASSADFPILFSAMEDVGGVLYHGGLEKALEEEDGGAAERGDGIGLVVVVFV